MTSGCGERKRERESESSRQTSVRVTAWLHKFPGALATESRSISRDWPKSPSRRPDPLRSHCRVPGPQPAHTPLPQAGHHLHIQARAFLLSTVILLSAAFYMSYHFILEFCYVTRDHSLKMGPEAEHRDHACSPRPASSSNSTGLPFPNPRCSKAQGRDKLSMAQAKRVEPHLWYQLRAK